MKIAVLYIRECPGHISTLAMIEQIIKEYRIKATVTAVEVIDPNTPGFLGSPTVRINGQDIERVAAGAARGLGARGKGRFSLNGDQRRTCRSESIG
jgi:hypothetical protein